MKIQGRDCTLTLAKYGYYYPLPYSEETVRETSKGYVLPPVIGKRNRQKYVEIKRVIEGCFVTRLDYNCIQGLFLLIFNGTDTIIVFNCRKYVDTSNEVESLYSISPNLYINCVNAFVGINASGKSSILNTILFAINLLQNQPYKSYLKQIYSRRIFQCTF